jgi:hypothetical protein
MAETRITLPKGVRPPIGLFVNGVELQEGPDFDVIGTEVVVKRQLIRAEKLGFWAWFLGAWGIGTYKKNDEVDIRYKRDGVTKVAHDVPYEGASTSGRD